MNTKPIIVFSILILLSGITLANESMVSCYNPYVEVIPHLLSVEKESLANFTNPESPIYDPSVVKVYGNVPKIETKSQLLEYVSTLRKIRDNSSPEMIPLLYPEGPVVQYGSDTLRGYIVIELYDDDEQETSYSESEFDKIYNILRKNAIKVGIDDYPVIFVLTNNTQIIGTFDMPAWFESDDWYYNITYDYYAEEIESLIQDLADQNVSVKVNAVKTLVEMGESAVDPLIQALENDNPEVRENAAHALGKIGDERAVESLIELLCDGNKEVKYAARDALANIGEPALNPLIRYIYDQNKSIPSREQAIVALGRIGEPAVGPLIQLLAERGTGLDGFAAPALNDIGEPAVEPLIQTLEDDNPRVRAHAASILGRIKDERAVEPLTKALNDEDERVRTFAKTSLERIANQNKYGVIAIYGREREFYIEDERREWLDKLDSIGSGVRDDMKKYIRPDGPVISYGYSYYGYTSVEFLEGSDIDEKLMDEIYDIFDQRGKQMGINDVPVLFQFDSIEVCEEATPNPKTPGFTAITLLVVFLGIFLRKQK